MVGWTRLSSQFYLLRAGGSYDHLHVMPAEQPQSQQPVWSGQQQF